MRKVTVRKDELLQKLEENRSRHVEAYNDAVAGYKAQALARLDQAIKVARRRVSESFESIKASIERFGEEPLPDVVTVVNAESFKLKVPKSQEKSYDVALAMARMEVADVIELSQDEFQCFVLDDWSWKDEFVTTNKMYSNVGKALK